ncbi:MAG: hypothetical protein K5768_03445 [Firmicutes bacterium]|nr:hypothetical protein [Bacillota bacterium]
MKKFMYTLVLLLIFTVAKASAEEIKIEGENYSSANFAPTIESGFKEFSGSSFVHTFVPMEKDRTYDIKFKVNAEKAGGYELKAITTRLNKGYTTDYTVIVNGKETINAATYAKTLSNISSSDWRDLFTHYDLGLVHLEEGENTIVFRAVNTDMRSDGLLVMWIDCFTLESMPFGIYDLVPYEDLGVFERKNKVEYTVQLVSKSESDLVLPFEVKNFWHKTVLKGKLSVMKGTEKAYLNLGKLDVGWYTIDVKYGSEVENASFVVSYNEDEYTKEDTPFAMDFAGSQNLINPNVDMPKFLRAAKLCGIRWLRDRFDYPSFNTAKDEYNHNARATLREDGIIHKEGFNVTVGFTASPQWTVQRGYYPADFMNVYTAFYEAAKAYGKGINMWECWNEEDTAFASEPADEYSAFMKTFAIAIADADVGTTSCIGGFAMAANETTFMDLCLQNGLLDYTSAYNCHVYGVKTMQDILPHTTFEEEDSHLDLVYTYGDKYDTPLWITEGGMSRTIEPGKTGMSWKSLKEVAQASVINVTQSLSQGTAKHFWFLWIPYSETTNDYGVFNKENEPRPVFSAYSNMIYQLRTGEYKGKLNNLPDGAEGHLFYNGKDYVEVIWSTTATAFKPKQTAGIKVYDLMGNECKVKEGENIYLSNYPIYIHYNNEADCDEYLPVKHNIRKIEPLKFTDAQKVVMCQRFYDRNYDTPRTDGYTIYSNGEDNICKLEVYNYNDREITAVITGTPETDGFVFDKATQSVTVPAKSKGIVEFNLKTTDTVKYDVTQFLRFEGTIDGEKMSPSVSRIIARSPMRTEPDAIFKNSRDVKNWDLTNISAGNTVLGNNVTEGGINFRIQFFQGDKWAYPRFKVDDASVLKGTSGLCFDVIREAEFTGFGMNVFLDLKDGRRYFLGNDNMMDVITQQYVVPWTKFIMFSSPYGVKVDTRTFDPTLIEQIEIGGNRRGGSGGDPQYIVKNVGYYTADFDLSSTDSVKIKISGVEDGAKYKEGEVPMAYATWNEGLEYAKIGVKLGSAEYENFTVNGNNMDIDFSELKKGRYRMMVYAMSDMGYVYKSMLYFEVE